MSIDQENIWNLIAKKLSGEASTPELTELEQLLRANPDLHYSAQPLMDLWQTDDSPDKAIGREAFNRHIQRMEDLGIDFSTIDTDASARPAGTRKKAILRVTAIAIPLLALVIIAARPLFLTNNSHVPQPAIVDKQPTHTLSEISTRNGSKTSLFSPTEQRSGSTQAANSSTTRPLVK